MEERGRKGRDKNKREGKGGKEGKGRTGRGYIMLRIPRRTCTEIRRHCLRKAEWAFEKVHWLVGGILLCGAG